MKYKENDITRLASRLVDYLLHEKQMIAKVDNERLRQVVGQIFNDNFKEEESINKEANDLLNKFDNQIQSGEVDGRKMFHMIRAKIAKERNFIL